MKDRKGQSLIEVLIGLAIGAVLIGAASLGVTFMLRSSASNQNVQIGTGLAQDVVDKVRTVAAAKWQDIYSITKGTSTSYFVNASGTQLIIVEGQEGVISNENTNGLIGYWKFDEATSTATTTAFDSSGNGYHGTLTNGPTRATTTCKVSYCLSFDGTDDYVDIGDPASGGLDFGSNGFTIAFWIKASSQPTNTIPLGKGNENCTTAGYRFIVNSGGAGGSLIAFVISDGTVTCSDDRTADVAGAVDSNWHHVVGVADRSNSLIKIYVDGLEKNSVAISLGSVSTGSNLTIGRNSNSVGGYFSGLIDEVRIYNRALSADEIQRLWNSVAFTRYFNVSNVNRDTNGNIVSSGGNEDPSTQKISVTVQWPGSGTNVGKIELSDFLTRWQNQVFQQTDWLGGAGQTGPITSPNSRYDSATSISNPAGSIRIQGL